MICKYCQRESDTIENRHRNTSYLNHNMNYLESCIDCYNEDYEYYKELWEDYYRSR